ncbi:MAG: hypothetical protein Q4B05_03950 [Candidatus Saccharibacteria bacterium]|nr:hypothetical protein [Candidatus Saccharibacteria bacterium]
MQDMHTVVILLSVLVGLLSILSLIMMGVIIALLVKVRRIAHKVDTITGNIARATEWLSPAKVFGEIRQLFHK